jgi:hypothetical protein
MSLRKISGGDNKMLQRDNLQQDDRYHTVNLTNTIRQGEKLRAKILTILGTIVGWGGGRGQWPGNIERGEVGKN